MKVTRTRAAPPVEQLEIDFKKRTPEEVTEDIVTKYKERAKTPLKAIRAFCVACTGGQVREVNKCTSFSCVLHPYRNGHNPNHGHGTEVPKLKIRRNKK